MPMLAAHLVTNTILFGTAAVIITGRFFTGDFIILGIEIIVQMSSSSNGGFIFPLDFRAHNSFTRWACLTFASFMHSLTLFLPGESLVVFGSLNLDDFFSGVCCASALFCEQQ
jgi:hypothetical protein